MQDNQGASSAAPMPRLPSIGLRNLKTAISATLCALLYSLIDRNATFACIGAVFGMDSSIQNSWRTGGNRMAGTIIGGCLGMAFFWLGREATHPLPRMGLLFVGIVLLIYISQLLRFAGAIQAGSVVFYIVMLNTPENQYVSYALNRMFDTCFGVFMSIFINWLHFRYMKFKHPLQAQE